MKKLFLLILIILASCSNQGVIKKMNNIEKAEYTLSEMIDSETPGLQYIILNQDSVLYRYEGGFANLEKRVPIITATTFNAFSVTKTFTALAILQLQEEGKLSSDDYAQKYIKGLPYNSQFTIRQLLNHTSGMPNPLPLKWVHLLDEHPYYDYQVFVKSVIEENDELNSKPGKKYSYSNIGYILLGQIIEKVSGEEYRTYIQNHIINKLKLTGDDFLGFEIPDITKHARGYIKKWSFLNFGLNFIFDKSKYMEDTYDGWTQFKFFYINGYSYGGLIGNADGFARYLQLLLESNFLLKDKTKNQLFAIQKTNHGEKIDMALSWFPGELRGHRYFAHPGGGGGYYSEIRVYPDDSVASVIIMNGTGVSDERILDDIDKYFF